jgi:hypothetical protein
MVFSLLPEGFHLIEGGVFGLPITDFKARFDSLDAADEFDLRGVKRVFRVELEMADEGDREQQIAKFLRDLGGLS